MTTADLLEPPRADRVARLSGGGTCTATALAAAVGPDTARYVLLRARPNIRPVLDLAALATATEANPAFRVRHAHTRLCAVARHAADLGVTAPADTQDGSAELHRLLADDRPRAPHQLARHLEQIVDAVARFEVDALPLGDHPVTDAHRSRVALCAAARGVLARGLAELGVSAPERM